MSKQTPQHPVLDILHLLLNCLLQYVLQSYRLALISLDLHLITMNNELLLFRDFPYLEFLDLCVLHLLLQLFYIGLGLLQILLHLLVLFLETDGKAVLGGVMDVAHVIQPQDFVSPCALRFS